ncbi:hypothetical protein [Streptomyces mayteni]
MPWASSYPAAVALALLALTPFLVLTTATSLMRQPLLEQSGATPFELQLAVGLSTAGYAFGAVAAADLIQRVRGAGCTSCARPASWWPPRWR